VCKYVNVHTRPTNATNVGNELSWVVYVVFPQKFGIFCAEVESGGGGEIDLCGALSWVVYMSWVVYVNVYTRHTKARWTLEMSSHYSTWQEREGEKKRERDTHTQMCKCENVHARLTNPGRWKWADPIAHDRKEREKETERERERDMCTCAKVHKRLTNARRWKESEKERGRERETHTCVNVKMCIHDSRTRDLGKRERKKEGARERYTHVYM